MMSENIRSMDTLIIEHRDKDGNLKSIFQEFKYISYLINKGLLSPHIWKIPYITGYWSTHKETIIWE